MKKADTEKKPWERKSWEKGRATSAKSGDKGQEQRARQRQKEKKQKTIPVVVQKE